jgi:hypothetical protein
MPDQPRDPETGRFQPKDADAPPDQSPDVDGSFLKRTLQRFRFGYDRNDDGYIEVKRETLYLRIGILLFGGYLGHGLAHDPETAYQFVTILSGGFGIGRVLAILNRTPLKEEWFDSLTFTLFIGGILVGVAYVQVPPQQFIRAVLDWLAHQAGTHTHP